MTVFFRERKLVTLALCYGAGVLAGFYFAFSLFPALLACVLSLGLVILARCSKRGLFSSACILFVTLGFLLTGLAANPARPNEGRYTVTGVISSTVERTDAGKLRAYLTDVTLTDADGNTQSAGKAYFTWTPPDEESESILTGGDRVRLTGRVYLPSGQENPYGYDFRTYLLTKGIGYGVSCSSAVEVTEKGVFTVSGALAGLRQQLVERCRAIFGEQSALPEALLLGYRADLPDETNSAFSDAGIAHILAVSGLHVTLIAGILQAFLRLFHLSPRTKLISVSVFLLCYSALLGFTAPVVRASLLTVILLFSSVIRRRTDPLTALAAAFLIILLFRPMQLFTASFQLSFCAVLGIILLGDRFSALSFRNHTLDMLWRFWQMTFAATLGVMIPTVCTFRRVSLIGFLINPFVCALMGLLLPFYAVIYVLGIVYLPLGTALGSAAGIVTGAFTKAIAWVGQLPGATVQMATPSLPVIMLSAVLLIVITRYVIIKRNRRIIIGGLCAAGIVLISVFGVDHSLRYVQLSVGQADCAVLIDDRETIVIDTGENGGDLAAYLLSQGLSADTVMITHLHMDHFGGIRQLLDQQVRIGRVVIPEEAELFASGEARLMLQRLMENGIPVIHAARGDVLSTSRAKVSVLWPERGRIQSSAEANYYSMALYLDLDGVTMLEMSDLPAMYEEYAAYPAEILKVAHHGSKTSTGEQFLRAVSPGCAVITATRFSTTLPSAAALQRLEDAAVPVLRTDETGCITIRFRNGEYQIETFRGDYGSSAVFLFRGGREPE